MTIANNVVAKSAAVVAGLALVFSAFVVPAKAATQAELEAQIQALMSQIASMNGGATTGAAFTADMTIGASGAEVTRLQNWLISKGYSIPAGATGYFGAQTAAAVAAYQTAKGITPAAGYFGPMTRAAVNAELGTGSTGGDTDGDTDNDGDLEGGAGSLDDADFISSLNNEDAGEGDETEVAGLELEADDNSDLEITAVRVSLEATDVAAGSSEDLDDYAESIVVYFDGEEVASEDVDDMDESAGIWSSTISLEDSVIDAGATGELVIAVVAHENIDSDDIDDNEWEVSFDNVRYMDAQGAVVTESSVGDIGAENRAFEFTTFTTANDVEFNVDESSETPEEGTVQVDEDGGDEEVLLIGEMDSEGSDLMIEELVATIATDNTAGTSSPQDLFSEFVLVIDGDVVATVDSDDCDDADCDDEESETYTFEDFEFELGDGETAEFEVRGATNEIDGTTFAEGDSVTVTVAATGITAEDASGEELTSERDGTANGEELTFRSEGLAVTVNDESDADANEGVGEFTFVLDVTAFGEEVELTESDFNYTVTGGPSGSSTSNDATLDEGDFEEDGGTVTIEEDDEGQLTFTVFVSLANSSDNGVYRVTLTTVDDSDPVTVNEYLETFISSEVASS